MTNPLEVRKFDGSPATTAAGHRSRWTGDVAILIYVAAATVIVHLATGGQYGFHRDELATLEDARHMAWGFVAYPPITPFFGRLSLILFGTSLTGFRFFASLAEAVAVVLTGLMARELGGGRGAQLVAAAAAVPFCLAAGAVMQYISFDYLCWVLAAYFVVRLLKTEDPRWWLAIGTTLGLGMMTKYTMGFFVIGIVVGVVATNARRYLASKWLWLGVALSIAVFAPNLVWQAQRHFVSLEFLKDIHERDIEWGRTTGFLPNQIRITLFAFPLWLAGLYFYFMAPAGRRFRMLGWMYVVPLVLFVAAKGREYYLAPAYPMLYAAGSVWGEQWLRRLRHSWAVAARSVVWIALAANIAIVSAFMLPLAPIKSSWWKRAARVQGDFREEVGWPELTETVARIRDSLPEKERARVGVLAGNYGEAGAIDLYGPSYGLPQAISGINSFWERGYGDPPAETLIVLGFSRGFLERKFSSCELAGHTWNTYNIENEETRDHPDIYVCRGMRQSWPEFWKDFQYYG
ncbi:MAG: glycosyltransferase family 39 protein [Terriglobales bacterium]